MSKNETPKAEAPKLSAADVQARRDARRAEYEAARDAQLAIDLEAIDALEQSEGYANIAAVDVKNWEPGFPAKLAVRAPDEKQYKRFRETAADKKDGRKGDAVQATQQLAAVCVAYPDKDTYQALLKVRPGIDLALGNLAAKLAGAEEESKGKE